MMHPVMTGSLAGQRRRDMAAAAARAQHAADTRRFGAACWRAPTVIPRFRVTWTKTTLALADGPRSPRSWVLVISATRAR
jgi:hypothetical protein